MTKSEKDFQQINLLLERRINKLGIITTDEAWKLLGSEFNYGVIQRHFRVIMIKLVKEGKADIVRNGKYFIHKNSFCFT